LWKIKLASSKINMEFEVKRRNVIGLNEVVSGGEQERIRREFEKVIYKSGHSGRVPIVLPALTVAYFRMEANSKSLNPVHE
jgi:hypothetical protein